MKLISKFVRRSLTGVTALGLIAGANVATAAGTLNVSNWAEYIGEETIANFEKEFDIKVTYDNYDSVEAIDAKLLASLSCRTLRICAQTSWRNCLLAVIRATSMLCLICGVHMASHLTKSM